MSNNTLIFAKDETDKNRALVCDNDGVLQVGFSANAGSTVSIADYNTPANTLLVNPDGSINVNGGGGGGGGPLEATTSTGAIVDIEAVAGTGTGRYSLATTDIKNTYTSQTSGTTPRDFVNSYSKMVGNSSSTVEQVALMDTSGRLQTIARIQDSSGGGLASTSVGGVKALNVVDLNQQYTGTGVNASLNVNLTNTPTTNSNVRDGAGNAITSSIVSSKTGLDVNIIGGGGGGGGGGVVQAITSTGATVNIEALPAINAGQYALAVENQNNITGFNLEETQLEIKADLDKLTFDGNNYLEVSVKNAVDGVSVIEGNSYNPDTGEIGTPVVISAVVNNGTGQYNNFNALPAMVCGLSLQNAQLNQPVHINRSDFYECNCLVVQQKNDLTSPANCILSTPDTTANNDWQQNTHTRKYDGIDPLYYKVALDMNDVNNKYDADGNLETKSTVYGSVEETTPGTYTTERILSTEGSLNVNDTNQLYYNSTNPPTNNNGALLVYQTNSSNSSSAVGAFDNIHSGSLTAGSSSSALNINNTYGNESVLSYQDATTTATGYVSIWGSLDNTNWFYLGVMSPTNIVRSTIRVSVAVLKLSGVKYIRITNEEAITLDSISATLVSG